MPAEDHFINRGLLKVKVNDFLRRELRRAGYAGVDLQKSPLGMRVVIYAARPGMVIGRRGSTVRELTEILEHKFGLEAPQIEVSEVGVPELNGSIMAERLAQRLERGDHFRRAAYGVLRRIVGAGARGVEISIAGKLTSRRARYQKFRSGFVSKTGEPIRKAVSHGIAYAVLKPGILGVQVHIMLPDIASPDRPVIIHRELEVEAVPPPATKEAEIEIIEEELPIEEALPLEEYTDESEMPSPETLEPEKPGKPDIEPAPEPEPTPKPAPQEPMAEPQPEKKPEAEPKKVTEPDKAKEKAKPAAKPKARKEPAPKAEKAKPKAKADKEIKAKAEPKTKPSSAPKEKKPKAAEKAKPKTSASKEKAEKSTKKSSKK